MLDNHTERKEQSRVSAAVAKVETLLVGFSAASLVVIMLVVVADVTMRYVVRSPLGWSYDLIGTYLMVCVFFFALSDTLHHHGHIAMNASPMRSRAVSSTCLLRSALSSQPPSWR